MLTLTPPIVPRRKPLREPLRSVVSREASSTFDQELRPLSKALEEAFDTPFAWLDLRSSHLVHCDQGGFHCDHYERLDRLRTVARRGKPEIVENTSPFTILAIPIQLEKAQSSLVAVGVFVNKKPRSRLEVAEAANNLGVDAGKALQWSLGREIWSERQLLRTAELALQNLKHEDKLKHMRNQIGEAVSHARDTYIELGLLHRVAQELDFSMDEIQLWGKVAPWLANKVSAQCIAIVPNSEICLTTSRSLEQASDNLICGKLHMSQSELMELIKSLGPPSGRKPLILSRQAGGLRMGPFSMVRDLVCIPIHGGETPVAWLLAINSTPTRTKTERAFNSVETRLLSSVANVLGVHSSSARLRQEQQEFFAGSVRALIAALDAKDDYTAGHSQRVARISVLLGKKLGLTQEQIQTVYLAGQLHDIGKIGIDERILNKVGKLTSEEFAEIKKHPQFGYDILKDAPQLQQILPVVLYHHEAWNGEGYPFGLSKEETPLLARIVAVADSYDAMVSDRPYRAGMSYEKLDKVLSEGAGSQWDPSIIEAYFEIRDEVRSVSEKLSLTHTSLLVYQDLIR